MEEEESSYTSGLAAAREQWYVCFKYLRRRPLKLLVKWLAAGSSLLPVLPKVVLATTVI